MISLHARSHGVGARGARAFSIVLLLFLVLPVSASTRADATRPLPQALPLIFELNAGQTSSDVKFLSRGAGYTLFLTPAEMVLGFVTPAAKEKGAVLRMTLPGANVQPRVSGLEELPGKVNYFIGNDPAQWRANVPTYAKVRYDSIYPGVDLIYYGNQRQFEYDFVVAPGADPRAITLAFDGPETLVLDAQGDLVFQVEGGELRLRKPLVYQEVDGSRKLVAANYVLKSKGHLGVQVAAYDTTKSLIIDPVLVYSTYLGGGGTDIARGIAADKNTSGIVYVTGDTLSTNFPTKAPSPSTPYQSTLSKSTTTDCFIAKIDTRAGASSLVYSTYLGGSGNDQCFGIAVDGSGSAYVTGQTSSTNFPGSSLSKSKGGGDVFVVKLNSTGSSISPALGGYAVFLGGSSADAGLAIAVDSVNQAYVTGNTTSKDFPVIGGFQATPGVAGGDPSGDAFVTKLNAAGTLILYSSYLGGSGADAGRGIAVSLDPHTPETVYVTGTSPGLHGPSDTFDAFVTKIDTTRVGASSLVYFTRLGGSCADFGQAIAVDSFGNAYVTGQTFSVDFPGAGTLGFQPAIGDASLVGGCGATTGGDAFVAKLSADGSTLLYSTYLGGGAADQGLGIAVDGSSGHAYVTGQTSSRNLLPPSAPNALYPVYMGGASDAFVARLNTIVAGPLSLVQLTYLGGGGDDAGRAIALDRAGLFIFVAGETSSSNFGIGSTRTGFQPSLGGTTDAFVAVLSTDITPPPVPTITSPFPASPTNFTSATFNFSDTEGSATFLCRLDSGSFTACASPTTYSGLSAGAHTFQVKAKDAAGNESGAAAFTWTVDLTAPTISALSDSPDPFSPKGNPGGNDTISYTLSEAANVTLQIYNATGSLVRTLVNNGSPGTNSQVWDGKNDLGAFVADGTYTYKIVATDAAGNVSAQASGMVTVDNTPPTSTITFPIGSPYNASGWNGGCSTPDGDICGTASDSSGSGVQKVEVSVKQNGTGKYWTGSAFASASEVFTVATGTTNWSLPFAASNFPAEGSYTVHARATDKAANMESSPTTTFTIDTTPPVFGAVSNLMFQGSAGTNVAYSNPTATDAVTQPPTVACVPASGSAFPSGDSNVTCTATDVAGNSSSTTFTITVQSDPIPTLTATAQNTTVRQGDPIILTAAINVSQSTTTITPDCVNTTWTIQRSNGSTVEPKFRERMYGIPNDLSTLAAGVPTVIQCDISEVIDPSLLPPGLYTFFATYSNYIRDLDPTPPVFNVWTGSVSSPNATLTVSGSTIRVGVDVKPNGFPNSWNCGSTSGLPVAVLSGEVFDPVTNTRRLFDPRTIDVASVRFGRTGGQSESFDLSPSITDVNGDGVPDLIFHFPFASTGFSCSDISSGQQNATVVGVLKGQTLPAVPGSAVPVSGSDSIRLVTGAPN